jgi:peptide/nickel transport system substrate-binding protein
MRTGKVIPGLVAVAAATALAAGCGGGSTAQQNSTNQPGSGTKATGNLLDTKGIVAGGTLRVGFSGPLVEADPHKSQSLQDQQQLENIYRGLTKPKSPADPTPVGDLATSWTVSKDQLTWTFKLRPGVTFHDGKPLTAADVKYSIERILDPKTVATAASDFAPVKLVDAVDDSTIRFNLRHPYSILPVALGLPAWAAIVPKGSGPTIAKKPDGTGPFEWGSEIPKTSLTLNKFPGYWDKGEPHVDRLVFTYIPDENARVNAVRTGQVDFIDSVPLAQTSVLQRSKNVSVVKFDSSWVDEFGLNTQRKPFSDPKVRQAIAHALNRPEIAKLATFGLGKTTDTMVAPTSPVKVHAKSLAYDPALAKKLLQQAGYPNGFSMTFAPCGGDSFPAMVRAGQVVARQLNQVGIKAKAQTLESGVWADQVITKHAYDGFICGLVNGNDPDGHSYRYFRSDGAFNFSQYKGPARLDDLLEQGREEADPAQRAKIYDEAWTMINQDAPWIPLYEVPAVVAASTKVLGFEPYPEFNLRFETVGFAK